MSGEADKLVKNYSKAAESREIEKRNIEKNAMTEQQAKEEAIANVYEMAGKIKATNFFKSQSEFFNLVMLKKVKDSKEYRERFGMTWEQFCDHCGLNRRVIDRQLEDLMPFRQEFLDNLSNFSGVTISKIKYLGIAVSGHLSEISDNAITYNGETIPIDAEHRDELQALLENLEASHKAEKEELEAAVSAQKKVAAAKEKVINNLEKDLKRLERTVAKSEMTAEEQDAINLLAQVQSDFLGWLSDIHKKIKPNEAPEIALRSFYYLLIFMSKACLEERMKLEEVYRDAEAVPWEIRDDELEVIPEEVLADSLPTFVGRGVGKKLKEKMEQREAKKAAKKGTGPEKDN